MVEIHGSRQTVNDRYHQHAMERVNQEMTQRILTEPGYAQSISGGGMYMPTPGFGMPGMCMPGFGMGGMNYGIGGYQMGGFGMPGMGFGAPVPSWFMDLNMGMQTGSAIGRFVNKLFGRNTQQMQYNQVSYQQQSGTVQPGLTRTVQPTSTGTVQTQDKTPATSDVDTSSLPTGSTLNGVRKGNVGGQQTYIADVTNADGQSEFYTLTKDKSGSYKIGAKLTKSTGNSNYSNDAKLTEAIEKEFGKGFKLPDGYKAQLVGDTLVVKDAQGQILGADRIAILKTTGATPESDAEALLKDADKDGNKMLSYQEFGASIKQQFEENGIEVTDEINEQINNFAKSLDTDKSGQIEKAEIEANYAKILAFAQEIETKTVGEGLQTKDDILEAADLDGNGQIDKGEWEEYQSTSKDMIGVDPGEFDSKDKNGDGVISPDELE